MSISFNGKNFKDLFFNGHTTKQIFYGARLVWQKIQHLLVGGRDSNSNCYEFIPENDITLRSISFLGDNNNNGAKYFIFNECGICIAYCNGNGVQTNVTIYGHTGHLRTSNALTTQTLYAGQKYYIMLYGNNDGVYGAVYQNESTNCIVHPNPQNINNETTAAQNKKCSGSASNFDEICQKGQGQYFIWRGVGIGNNMVPADNEPYPFMLNKDMSRVKKMFTDSDFNHLEDDIERWAFIFYTMGTNEGDEFLMNAPTWRDGFKIYPNDQNTKVFGTNERKFFRISGSMGVNHINSMTPLDSPPDNPDANGIYYKSNAQTWGNISARAVVVYHDNTWKIADDWMYEWSEQSEYNGQNYCTKIEDNYAKEFNKKSITTTDRYYIRVGYGSDGNYIEV